MARRRPVEQTDDNKARPSNIRYEEIALCGTLQGPTKKMRLSSLSLPAIPCSLHIIPHPLPLATLKYPH